MDGPTDGVDYLDLFTDAIESKREKRSIAFVDFNSEDFNVSFLNYWSRDFTNRKSKYLLVRIISYASVFLDCIAFQRH